MLLAQWPWSYQNPANDDEHTKRCVANFKYPVRRVIVKKFLQPMRNESPVVNYIARSGAKIHFYNSEWTDDPEPGLHSYYHDGQ